MSLVTDVTRALPSWDEEKVKIFKEKMVPFRPNAWNRLDNVLQSLWFSLPWIFGGCLYFFVVLPVLGPIVTLGKGQVWYGYFQTVLGLVWLTPFLTVGFAAQNKVRPPVWSQESLQQFFTRKKWIDLRLLEFLGKFVPSRPEEIGEWWIEYCVESPYIIIWRRSIRRLTRGDRFSSRHYGIPSDAFPYLVYDTRDQKDVLPQ